MQRCCAGADRWAATTARPTAGPRPARSAAHARLGGDRAPIRSTARSSTPAVVGTDPGESRSAGHPSGASGRRPCQASASRRWTASSSGASAATGPACSTVHSTTRAPRDRAMQAAPAARAPPARPDRGRRRRSARGRRRSPGRRVAGGSSSRTTSEPVRAVDGQCTRWTGSPVTYGLTDRTASPLEPAPSGSGSDHWPASSPGTTSNTSTDGPTRSWWGSSTTRERDTHRMPNGASDPRSIRICR